MQEPILENKLDKLLIRPYVKPISSLVLILEKKAKFFNLFPPGCPSISS